MNQSQPLIPLSASDRAKRFSIRFGLILLLYGGALTAPFYFTDAYLSRPDNEAYPLPLIMLCGPGAAVLLSAWFLRWAWVAIVGLVLFGFYLIIAIFAAIAWLAFSFGNGYFSLPLIAWNIGLTVLWVGLVILLYHYARCSRGGRDLGINQHGFEPLPVNPIAASTPIFNAIPALPPLNPQIPPTPAADNQGK